VKTNRTSCFVCLFCITKLVSLFSTVNALSHTSRVSGFPIGHEEVRPISNPPADLCLRGGFEIDVSAEV
jgi:hypothetical protein